jgi:hypothetical protein
VATPDGEVFELDQVTWDELVERSWSDFPYEVCGLLGLSGPTARSPTTRSTTPNGRSPTT